MRSISQWQLKAHSIGIGGDLGRRWGRIDLNWLENVQLVIGQGCYYECCVVSILVSVSITAHPRGSGVHPGNPEHILGVLIMSQGS